MELSQCLLWVSIFYREVNNWGGHLGAPSAREVNEGLGLWVASGDTGGSVQPLWWQAISPLSSPELQMLWGGGGVRAGCSDSHINNAQTPCTHCVPGSDTGLPLGPMHEIIWIILQSDLAGSVSAAFVKRLSFLAKRGEKSEPPKGRRLYITSAIFLSPLQCSWALRKSVLKHFCKKPGNWSPF